MNAIALNDSVDLEISTDSDKFLGLGGIRIGGVAVRNSLSPMFVDIRTPDGVQMTDFRLLDQYNMPDGVRFEFGMSAQPGGLMEWMLHEVRPRINTRGWGRGPESLGTTRLFLEIKPVERQFGGRSAVGFSYQYRYQSDEHRIYKITDRSSWEIGGAAGGNEFWLRNAFGQSINAVASCTQRFSSEWYVRSAMNSSIFQFLPWQTELEGFSLTCHVLGSLVTWASKVGHIRSLFEKQRGRDEIAHWHEHCGDLSNELSTLPMEVLWLEGQGTDPVDRLNLYHDVRETVAEELHRDIGFRRERIATYGVIEEWGTVDMARYRTHGEPKLAAAGVKRIFLANHFQNDMNVYGVSNMCCTLDYKVAESVGEQKLADFCAAANKDGIDVEMWGNTAVSTFGLKAWDQTASSDRLSPLPIEGSVMEMIRQADDPFVRNPAGHMEADHYAPVFAQLNLRDESVRKYWHKAWTYARRTLGLSGIFLDSSFNLSSDKFHWVANPTAHSGDGATADQTELLGKARPDDEPPAAILSQYMAHLSLIREMQKIGYVYCAEDIGVFGIHRAGPSITDLIETLPLWSDCLCTFDAEALRGTSADPNLIFFKALAYRMMWRLAWDMNKDELTWWQDGRRSELDEPTHWQLSLLSAFNTVENDMRHRTILPNEQGVQYKNGTTQILWTFEDLELEIPGEQEVTDILNGQTFTACSKLSVPGNHIYRLAPLQ